MGTGTSLVVAPDALDLSEFPTMLGGLHAWYTTASFEQGGHGVWRDASGGGRDAVVQGNAQFYEEQGHGAAAPLRAVEGGVGTSVTFTNGTLPSEFSVCIVARYTSGVETEQGSILAALGSEWYFGHHAGRAGVASAGSEAGWREIDGVQGVATDWTVLCGRGQAPFRFNVNGRVDLGKGLSGVVDEPPDSFGVNNEEVDWARFSSWAIHELAVWARALTADEIDALAARYRARLALGSEGENGIWARPQLSWANSRTRIGEAVSITIAGRGFGADGYTAAVRAGGSACDATDWLADTSIVCAHATGTGGSQSIVVTVGVRARGVSEALSYDRPTLLAGYGGKANAPATGAISFSISGAAFAESHYSPAVRVGGTPCEATRWVADSSVHVRTAAVPPPSY